MQYDHQHDNNNNNNNNNNKNIQHLGKLFRPNFHSGEQDHDEEETTTENPSTTFYSSTMINQHSGEQDPIDDDHDHVMESESSSIDHSTASTAIDEDAFQSLPLTDHRHSGKASMTLQYNKKQLGSTNGSKKKKVNILHGHRSLPLNQLSTPLDSDQDQEEVEEDPSTTTTEPVVQSDVDYEENLHSDHLNHRPLVISKSPKAFRDEIDSLKASMRQMEMKIEELNEQKETDSDNKLNSAYDLNLVPRPPPFTPSPQHLRTRAPLFFVGVAHNTSAAEWSDWSEWAECFCNRQLRTRTCEYEASYLTAGCVGVSYESRVCSGGVPCPTTTEPPHVSTLSAVTARQFYTLAPQIGPLAGYAFRPNYLAQSMARLTELRRVQR